MTNKDKQPPIRVEEMSQAATANQYSLNTWLINGPFHPAWNQWVVNLVHLRPTDESPEPTIVTPGATHELVIGTQDPEYPLMADAKPEEVRILSPLDVQQQLVATDDAHAIELVENCLDLVRAGRLSPDQDFRKAWEYLLAGESDEAKAPKNRTH